MKTILLAAVGLGIFFAARAEMVKNPDENTLWLENGRNMEAGEWRKGLDIVSGGEEGGFTFKADGKRTSTGSYVPLNNQYPWLVFEVASYTPMPKQYKNCWIQFLHNTPLLITIPVPGIYIHNVFRGSNSDNPSNFLSVALYGYQVDFKYMKMVKVPENYFTVESAAFDEKKCFENGDTLVFTARLAAEAEDVSIMFLDTYGHGAVRINGQDSITLKPVNPERTEWKAELKVDSITGYHPSADKTFFFKCVVLGGKLPVPLYSNNFFPYRAPAKK